MFIELVDQLRCPVPHEASWLVAAVDVVQGRYIERGTLGCPVCRARYEIRGYVTFFSTPVTARLDTEGAADSDAVARLAAQLNLTQPGGYVVMTGAYGRLAASLAATYEVHCVVLDHSASAVPGEGVSVFCTDAVPLALGSVRGAAAALDSVTLPAVAAAVRPGGRVVSPVDRPIPAGIRELARDDLEWVGEREPGSGPLIELGRAAARD